MRRRPLHRNGHDCWSRHGRKNLEIHCLAGTKSCWESQRNRGLDGCCIAGGNPRCETASAVAGLESRRCRIHPEPQTRHCHDRTVPDCGLDSESDPSFANRTRTLRLPWSCVWYANYSDLRLCFLTTCSGIRWLSIEVRLS